MRGPEVGPEVEPDAGKGAVTAVGTAVGTAVPLGPALYVDGVAGHRLEVRLLTDGADLLILRADGRELDRWPGAELRPMPASFPDGGGEMLGLGPDGLAALQVGAEVRTALAAAFPTSAGPAHRSLRRVPLLGWLAGAAVSLVLIVAVLIPALAEPLSRMVPFWLQDRIGREVADIVSVAFQSPGAPLRCETPPALDRIMQRLETAAGPDAPPFQVRVIGSRMVNAFAAPGGHIVIPAGMIRFAEEPEALAGVIAHEMGHVVHGDSMARLMRVGLMSVVVSMVTGDFAGGIAGTLAVQMLESGYSQAQERAADAYAASLLTAAGLSLDPFAGLFDRMEQRYAPKGEPPPWARWMATHPPLAERVATLRAVSPPEGTRPLLSAQEWQELQDVCLPRTPVRDSDPADGAGGG